MTLNSILFCSGVFVLKSLCGSIIIRMFGYSWDISIWSAIGLAQVALSVFLLFKKEGYF
jgi:predicted Kef-type K+ transport protein